MRKYVLAAGLAVFLAAPAAICGAADLPAGHPPLDKAQKPIPSHTGEVLEAIPAASYIYLHVKTPEGDEWLAGPAGDFKPKSKVRWNDGMIMQKFTSPTLKRTFDSIRFVEVLEHAD